MDLLNLAENRNLAGVQGLANSKSPSFPSIFEALTRDSTSITRAFMPAASSVLTRGLHRTKCSSQLGPIKHQALHWNLLTQCPTTQGPHRLRQNCQATAGMASSECTVMGLACSSEWFKGKFQQLNMLNYSHISL